MNGREAYAIFRDSHGQEQGVVLPNFDAMVHAQRAVWERFANNLIEEFMADLRERGVMWEPTS